MYLSNLGGTCNDIKGFAPSVVLGSSYVVANMMATRDLYDR